MKLFKKQKTKFNLPKYNKRENKKPFFKIISKVVISKF